MYGDISEHKYLFHKGTDYRSCEFLGARPAGRDPEDGYIFRVWAPEASKVAVAGDFNGWDADADPMHRLDDDDTIWEAVVRRAREGALYKYAVTSGRGETVYKADPYAFKSEHGSIETGSQRASITYDIKRPFRWSDEKWRIKRDSSNPYRSPVNIYEVHLGSWRHVDGGRPMTYRELAHELMDYVLDMGYTHIELLPVMEYPYDGSWGYQVSGYFSITSRYGSPDDFRYLVNEAHRKGIGVILDWVPAHFPKDEHGLVEFDGHPLYEDSDAMRMEHKEWGTRAFDFGKPEVVSFLVSSAFFLCSEYHVDGLRVDAVSAMLYLDYCRKEGEWHPNEEGGVENRQAEAFLRRLNRCVLTEFPGVLMIAEESTAWPGITRPPSSGGLGFNFKWNMGWMNDVLSYFSTDPLFRKGAHNDLTFAITYAYSENFILPVSHDEVVHGKRSLIDKMPGGYEEKFAGMRSFLVYMFTHPGKKLTFMGTEIGQFSEWDEKKELDWFLLEYESHRKMQSFVRSLNRKYRKFRALWTGDDSPEGFRWIEADDSANNVYAYMRFDTERDDIAGSALAVVINLSGRDIDAYDIGVPGGNHYWCILDTDDARYGGTGVRRKRKYKVKDGECCGYSRHITVSLPELSAMILERRN